MEHLHKVVFTSEFGDAKPLYLSRIPYFNEKIFGIEDWPMMQVSDIFSFYKKGLEESTTVFLSNIPE